MNKETVSVIICCYTMERIQDIRAAVASVQGQTQPPEEIILAVDNNRALYETLKTEFTGSVRVVLNDSAYGLSATRNAGVAAAQGELVAFLDDDAEAERDWLARLVAPFADPTVYATGGRAVLRWPQGRPAWFPDVLDWVVGGSFTWLPLRTQEVSNPHGHNMCFRRGAIATVGMFNTALGRRGNRGQAGEERELCLRLVHCFPEAKIIYEPAAVVYHKVPLERVRWSYLIKRSYQEGVCKALIHHIARPYKRDPLSSEKRYLRYLLFRAIPSRLRRFWRLEVLAQIAAILLCIAATATGYLIGRWRLQGVSRGLLEASAG
jgi:glycosyltransferase involved in cell wall biosynthesis